MDTLTRLVDAHTRQHADTQGACPGPIPGLSLLRATAPGDIIHLIFRPVICLVLQGAKQVATGAQVQDFIAGQSVLVSMDRPVTSHIVHATPTTPYLALALELDAAILQSLVTELGAAPTHALPPPMQSQPTEPDVAATALRMLALIGRPQAAATLQAGLLREMHYWLLAGRHGPALRALGQPQGHAQRIARAVALLRRDYTRPVAVEALAAEAGMSPSSFHQHFRAATTLTPIQFQKQLRLIEARRLMLQDGLPAGRAAFTVGYESASQFSRDYARQFGAPPRRETRAAA